MIQAIQPGPAQIGDGVRMALRKCKKPLKRVSP